MIDGLVKVAGSLFVGGIGLVLCVIAAVVLFYAVEELYRQYGRKK